MLHKVKVVVSKVIWKICGISWKVGNAVMDFIGYDNYVKVAEMHQENIFK